MDPTGPLALPRTEGDELAQSLPEPSQAWRPNTATPSTTEARPPSDSKEPEYDLGDEDIELQAALQASMMGDGGFDYSQFARGQPSQGQSSRSEHYSVPITSPATRTSPPSQGEHYRVPITSASDPGSEVHTPTELGQAYRHVSRGYDALRPRNEIDEGDDDLPPVIQDPVAASRARARALMEQARLEQEAALRDTYAEEQARVRAGIPTRRSTRQEQEEAELQRAIEESRALHEAQASRAGSTSDEDMDEDTDDVPPREQAPSPSPAATYHQHRVYDDDDAELQAALKASLESAPEGFRIPSPPSRPQIPPAPVAVQPTSSTQSKASVEDDREAETESEAESNILEEEPAELSMEEMRRRRLAKFGG